MHRINRFCDWYEEQIVNCGGIDLQLLGIGSNGHIGFNEPGSSLGSRTRIKTLSKNTRKDNARFFDNDLEQVPKYAITMGIGTILDSKIVLLIATGKNKAKAIKDTVEGSITNQVPASALQLHKRVYLIIDEAAAAQLSGSYDTFVTSVE